MNSSQANETQGFVNLGYSNWTICSLLNRLCSKNFSPFLFSPYLKRRAFRFSAWAFAGISRLTRNDGTVWYFVLLLLFAATMAVITDPSPSREGDTNFLLLTLLTLSTFSPSNKAFTQPKRAMLTTSIHFVRTILKPF